MQDLAWRRAFWLLMALFVFAPPVVTLGCQGRPQEVEGPR